MNIGFFIKKLYLQEGIFQLEKTFLIFCVTWKYFHVIFSPIGMLLETISNLKY